MRSRYFALDLSVGYFSFLAGNVLSASLSILFAFYKVCCCYKKKICICICKFEPGSWVFEGLI